MSTSTTSPLTKVLLCNKLFNGIQLKQQKITELESLQQSLLLELESLILLLKECFSSMQQSFNDEQITKKITDVINVLNEGSNNINNISVVSLSNIVDILGKTLSSTPPPQSSPQSSEAKTQN